MAPRWVVPGTPCWPAAGVMGFVHRGWLKVWMFTAVLLGFWFGWEDPCCNIYCVLPPSIGDDERCQGPFTTLNVLMSFDNGRYTGRGEDDYLLFALLSPPSSAEVAAVSHRCASEGIKRFPCFWRLCIVRKMFCCEEDNEGKVLIKFSGNLTIEFPPGMLKYEAFLIISFFLL